jgi:hypothetical protein
VQSAITLDDDAVSSEGKTVGETQLVFFSNKNCQGGRTGIMTIKIVAYFALEQGKNAFFEPKY